MKNIPILNIKQFENNTVLKDVYCNVLDVHLKNNSNIIHKPHKHDFYLCVIFEKGSGTHSIDFSSYKVQPGSVFFLKPGQTHFWEFDVEPQGYIFFHTPQFYTSHYPNKKANDFDFYMTQNPPHLILNQDQIENISLYYKLLYNEYYQNQNYKRQKLANLIDTIYIDLSRIYSNTIARAENQSPIYLKTLEAFELAIETHYKTEKTVTFYADQLNITTKHLNRITKQTINKTANQMINERVILEAKRLLSYNILSLSDIAFELGFEDYAYFSRRFKQTTKVSPLAFQKRYNIRTP
jgi:AraC-like DNA-binding protein